MLINYNRLEKTVSPLHLVLPLTLSARLSLSTRLSTRLSAARSTVSTANTSGSSAGHFILGAAIFILLFQVKMTATRQATPGTNDTNSFI